ncbi:DNA primase [Companilactobacillus alimentarius]|uniref:DNA primase n=1 Tax=Companilactobacillus alimentarius DSM 20249 TaxID=1423720 RepID=A0A2K9HPG9_9LACO|nr:DNA primase [Companilactobacillus alimentarius]AUI71262.1 DNA primase [Companilactobacillus alimentarius DSM 20249]KRK75399.1 DNA primase DnaG [Companilactobacillus alimentarius DSM 20249]MDT6951460.1 DNA primase [Companilactobacillus alimentarius]GEO43817.1 DNA primase [Companilactobacillus alimentarius]
MATRIPQEFIDEVTSKTNIVDVVSKYVQLKKSGKNLFGLCPFHEERTPSFSVAEDKQIFHCFSCGRGGNVFKFIMEIESKSFPESVIEVAQMGNIPVPDQYQATTQYQNSDSRVLLKMYSDAAKLYSHILLKTENGTQALKYLNNRDLGNDLIETFNIGYAPSNNDLLLQFFKGRDVSEDVLRKSGLFAENQEGQLFDRFRDRVMIPITDESGNIVAFSGRVLDKNASTAKYLNSPETSIFNKGKTLFNLSNAKKEIREKSNVILFEGFMDVISAYKAGVTNGVASMGTSLTDDQLYTLSRLTNQINVCYDGDDPGVEATYRALTQLNDDRFTYGVISIPDKKDPDEYIRSEGAEKFQNLTNNGVQTPISFILNYFKRNYNLNNEHDQLEFLNQSLHEIVKLQSPVEVDMYVSRVADEMGVSKEAINKELDTLRRQLAIKEPANNYKNIQQKALDQVTSSVKPKYDRLEKSERYLLYWAINFPEVRVNLKGDGFQFVHQSYQRIFDNLLSYVESDDVEEEINISDFMNVLDNDDKNLLADLEMMNMPDEYNDQEIDDYISNIKNSSLEDQIKEINQQLKKAAMVGDNKLQLDLTKQLINVRRILSN